MTIFSSAEMPELNMLASIHWICLILGQQLTGESQRGRSQSRLMRCWVKAAVFWLVSTAAWAASRPCFLSRVLWIIPKRNQSKQLKELLASWPQRTTGCKTGRRPIALSQRPTCPLRLPCLPTRHHMLLWYTMIIYDSWWVICGKVSIKSLQIVKRRIPGYVQNLPKKSLHNNITQLSKVYQSITSDLAENSHHMYSTCQFPPQWRTAGWRTSPSCWRPRFANLPRRCESSHDLVEFLPTMEAMASTCFNMGLLQVDIT